LFTTVSRIVSGALSPARITDFAMVRSAAVY
jgi:hypothetical protein